MTAHDAVVWTILSAACGLAATWRLGGPYPILGLIVGGFIGLLATSAILAATDD